MDVLIRPCSSRHWNTKVFRVLPLWAWRRSRREKRRRKKTGWSLVFNSYSAENQGKTRSITQSQVKVWYTIQTERRSRRKQKKKNKKNSRRRQNIIITGTIAETTSAEATTRTRRRRMNENCKPATSEWVLSVDLRSLLLTKYICLLKKMLALKICIVLRRSLPPFVCLICKTRIYRSHYFLRKCKLMVLSSYKWERGVSESTSEEMFTQKKGCGRTH